MMDGTTVSLLLQLHTHGRPAAMGAAYASVYGCRLRVLQASVT